MKNKKVVKSLCALALIISMPVAVSGMFVADEEDFDDCPSIAAVTGRGFVADQDFAWLLPEQELTHTGGDSSSCCRDGSHHTYN